ncbi:MAG: hypothetical protein A3208_07120 [Candidatus Methanoprimaticola hominis]|nr:MAG: hypothetical protein A3208_07120 [Methanomassiliicoccales archaeon Mx-06]
MNPVFPQAIAHIHIAETEQRAEPPLQIPFGDRIEGNIVLRTGLLESIQSTDASRLQREPGLQNRLIID